MHTFVKVKRADFNIQYVKSSLEYENEKMDLLEYSSQSFKAAGGRIQVEFVQF